MLKDLINSIKYKKCAKNYKKVLKNLKYKRFLRPLNVVFLIRENQKWTYQSVYEEFEKSKNFRPLVLVSLLTLVHKGKDNTRNNLDENYEFFKSRGMNVDYAYKDGKYIDLKEFSADIVFYDQPWDLPNIHKPENVSKYALTCYSSYSMELLDNITDYTQDFHKLLFSFFVINDYDLKRYESYKKGNSKNCVVVGYPKLDEYLNDEKECCIWKDNNKIKIIYAPHHSLDKKGLKLSTFRENGKFILDFAKKHPETTWVFKPHPRFKHALLRTKTLSLDEIDNYYNEWKIIGSVYEKGNYINLFRTSDVLVTDSISFLSEYLPSKKPIIRLLNSDSASKMNVLGCILNDAFYLSINNADLNNLFNDVILSNQDEKRNKRINIVNKIYNVANSSKMIYKNLMGIIGYKKNE